MRSSLTPLLLLHATALAIQHASSSNGGLMCLCRVLAPLQSQAETAKSQHKFNRADDLSLIRHREDVVHAPFNPKHPRNCHHGHLVRYLAAVFHARRSPANASLRFIPTTFGASTHQKAHPSPCNEEMIPKMDFAKVDHVVSEATKPSRVWWLPEAEMGVAAWQSTSSATTSKEGTTTPSTKTSVYSTTRSACD